MSYTAPTYVDTKEQAILALASVIADEDKGALGDGSVNRALDVLADVLANQDVQVPQTNAGAILALADYVSGGGGGGGDLTTATVTIVNSSASRLDGAIPSAVDTVEEGSYSTFVLDVRVGSTREFKAILYKGHCNVVLYSEGTVSIEGSATDLGGGAIDVSGNCTITVS